MSTFSRASASVLCSAIRWCPGRQLLQRAGILPDHAPAGVPGVRDTHQVRPSSSLPLPLPVSPYPSPCLSLYIPLCLSCLYFRGSPHRRVPKCSLPRKVCKSLTPRRLLLARFTYYTTTTTTTYYRYYNTTTTLLLLLTTTTTTIRLLLL